MTGQLSFPGLEPPTDRPRTDRLFFAIFPDPGSAERIAALAHRLRSEHDLSGKPLQPHRLHITVNHLDDYEGVPEQVVAAACKAAASLDAPAFDVVFDRIASFQGMPDKRPFVLRGDEGLADLIAFQKRLAAAMTYAGLGKLAEARFTPHVTLLYDPRLVPEQQVAQVRWTARELVLVHSLLGQSQHIPLARWALRG